MKKWIIIGYGLNITIVVELLYLLLFTHTYILNPIKPLKKQKFLLIILYPTNNRTKLNPKIFPTTYTLDPHEIRVKRKNFFKKPLAYSLRARARVLILVTRARTLVPYIQRLYSLATLSSIFRV